MSPHSWAGRALSPPSRCPPVTLRAQSFESSKLISNLFFVHRTFVLFLYSLFSFCVNMQNRNSSVSLPSSSKPQKEKQNKRPGAPGRQANLKRRKARNSQFALVRAQAPSESLLTARLQSQYARQLVLPSSVSSPILLPAETTRQMCSRIITKVFDVTPANLTASNSVVVVMGPNMLMPASVSRAGGTVIPSVGRDNLTAVGKLIDDVENDQRLSGLFQVTTVNGSKGDAPLVRIVDSLGEAGHGLFWNSAGGNVDCMLEMHHTSASTSLYFNVATTTGANPWSSVVHVGPLFERESLPFAFAVPVGTLGISFYWSTDAAGLVHTHDVVKYNLRMHDSAAAVTLGPDLTLFPEIPAAILDSKITDGRVVSMSVLLTNTTSDIYKQGDISIGRVLGELLLRPPSEWVTAMSALPENRRHLGQASQGRYAYWIPDSIQTSEPVSRIDFGSAYRDSEYLVAVIRNLDPLHTSFRATFTWNVEFFSESQLFEKRLTPSVTQDYKELFRAVSMMPAASCNPEHEGLFRSLFQKAIGGAGAVYQHYQGNKAMYDAIAKALAAALL